MKKTWVIVLLATILSGISAGILYLNSLMPVITGYPAKYLCSAVFISGRQQQEVESLDLNFNPIRFVSNTIDYRAKTVTSRFLWGSSLAVYRDGFGATLIRGNAFPALASRRFPDTPPATATRALQTDPLFPDDTLLTDDGRNNSFRRIGSALIEKQEYGGTGFAFVVLHQGKPVAEIYRNGFNKNTRFLSWSIAKSITNALIGILTGEGKLSTGQDHLFPEWQNDTRSAITIHDLLQMQSGLRWNEDYGTRSDVTLMLYAEPDFGSFALKQPPEHRPGTCWSYSSGTTNMLSLLIRRCFSTDSAYYLFARERLFRRAGMQGVVFETDAGGTQAGSSYVYASARDFARFGLLCLKDGVYNAERILPEGWMAYSTAPARYSKGAYGAHFWLNRNGFYPDAPRDMFSCNGHDGQRIFIIPSEELVVVVLGYSPSPDQKMDFNRLLKDILAAARTFDRSK